MSLLGMDDPRSALLMGLATGLLTPTRGGQFAPALSQGLMGGMQGYQAARQAQGQQQDREMRRRMAEAQLAQGAEAADMRRREFGMQEQRFSAEQAQQRAAMERQQRQTEYLQQVAAGRPISAAEAFAVGLSTADAKALAESGNWGRSTVKTWKQVRGQDGKVLEIGLDEFGQPVQGAQQTPFIEPKPLDLGGRVTMFDPTAVQPGQQFDKTMTPGEAANNRIAQGNLGVAQARLGLERQRFAADQAQNGAGAPLVFNAEVGGYIPKQLAPGQTPTVVQVPGYDGKVGSGQQRSADAKDVLMLLDEAEPLIAKATGSYVGYGADLAARAFGKSTDGAAAAAQLKVIEGNLVSKMPKMSGPQSDRDVMIYQSMAGLIGDPTVPAAQKRAAAATIRRLNQKYAAGSSGATGAWGDAPSGQPDQRVLMFDAQGNMIGGR